MIESERILLKPMSKADAAALFAYRSLPEVYQYQSWAPKNLEEADEFISRYSLSKEIVVGQWKQLGIYNRSDSVLMGDCGFCIFEEEQAIIGYTISPEFQRKGFGFEVTNLLVDYLFEKYNLHRLVAKTDPDNIASIKILEKIGFRKEGHSIKCVKIRGKWEDDVTYAILGEEWVTLKNKSR